MPRSDSKQDSRSESKDESKRDVGAEAKAGGYVAKVSKGDGGGERSTAAAAPPAAAAAAPKESKGDGGDERSTAAAADAAAPPVAAAAGPTASTMKFGKDEFRALVRRDGLEGLQGEAQAVDRRGRVGKCPAAAAPAAQSAGEERRLGLFHVGL